MDGFLITQYFTGRLFLSAKFNLAINQFIDLILITGTKIIISHY